MKIRYIAYDGKPVKERLYRAHYSDTGADIRMNTDGCILPLETKVVKLGFGIDIPNGYTGRMQVRTSIARKGIMIQGCAIDAGFTGELSMILHNISNEVFIWHEGDRLGYIEVYPVVYPDFVESLGEKRGDKAFGSTGG